MVTVSGSCAAFYFGVDVFKWLSPTRVCVSPSCVQLTDQLAASIDAAVNPCDDFYRFACGGIAGTLANSTLSASQSAPTPTGVHTDAVLSRVRTILANWAVEDKIQTPLQTSASLYQGCKAVVGRRNKGVRRLVSFLQKCRLNFAKDEDLDTDPLDSALSLDVRYNVKTLFDVAAEGVRLLVRPRRALETWSSQRQAYIRKHTYSDYLENTFTLLGFPTRMRVTFMAASVWETEDTVLRLFSRVKPDDKTLVKLDYVEPGTVMEHPDWKRHFGHLWDRAAVKGTSMAFFLKHVFAEQTPLAVTRYIFWEVVRQLGPLADYRLSAPDENTQLAADRCFRLVYDVAGLAPLAFVLVQEVSTKTVLLATSFISGLLRNVGAANVSMRVVDPRQLLQDRAFSAPSHGRRGGDAIAPKDSLANARENDESGTFFDSFLRVMLAMRERELNSLDAVVPMPTAEDLLASHVTVDARKSRVTVPTMMLVYPWFSPDVPRSFNYAGLGFAVVRELMRAGIRLKAHFPTKTIMAGSTCNHTTRGTDERALEMVLRVLDRSVHERNKLRLPGLLDSMSEEQLFFLAYCTGGCRSIASAYTAGSECNNVLRSMARFGSSFQCIRGMPMNPTNLDRCRTVQPSVKSRLRLMFNRLFWNNVTRKIANMWPHNWTIRYRRP
ncbi:hypothetical protein HPB51_004701 [Rhipicephalus microplus]|uniref:Peptidase M13 N-terminal domain-containing protein n=1 Tax=Rhipicephalus microplus TaxID=6941 RepID=A0A9J6DYW6_RHIMP|nr:hypothetical protein HPB51_004701 [Rhipicephalus microplus]